MFTNSPGRYVNLKDTIDGFEQILAGQHDDKPEGLFYAPFVLVTGHDH